MRCSYSGQPPVVRRGRMARHDSACRDESLTVPDLPARNPDHLALYHTRSPGSQYRLRAGAAVGGTPLQEPGAGACDTGAAASRPDAKDPMTKPEKGGPTPGNPHPGLT